MVRPMLKLTSIFYQLGRGRKGMRQHDSTEILLDGVHCDISVRSFDHQVVVLVISGTDVGEFGEVPMRKLEELMPEDNLVQLFVDARKVRGASIEVSAGWAKWMAANRTKLRRVNMLPGSRFIEITADFVRRFADLQGIMRIYTDAKAFDADLAESL